MICHGEGFIMQKLEGDGLSFVHSGGNVLDRTFAPDETIKIDTGCLVAMTSSVDYDIEFVKGIKTVVFGGEVFFATLRVPGKVWIQSFPFSRMSASNAGRREEGSILGGLGKLLDGR